MSKPQTVYQQNFTVAWGLAFEGQRDFKRGVDKNETQQNGQIVKQAR